jgi:hypothetical protein
LREIKFPLSPTPEPMKRKMTMRKKVINILDELKYELFQISGDIRMSKTFDEEFHHLIKWWHVKIEFLELEEIFKAI